MANVTIHIIPEGCNQTSFNPQRDGMNFSSKDEIKVNTAVDGYSIVYTEDVFKTLNPQMLIFSMIEIFKKNLPDTNITLRIHYHYDVFTFDDEVGELIMYTHTFVVNLVENGKVPGLSYQGVNDLEEIYDHVYTADDLDDDDDEDDDDDDIWKGFGSDPIESNNDYYHPSCSKTWRKAKDLKKSIRRHGVVIAADKEDLKKDEKVIREFLKEFLPGNADWKREFRADVAKRWVQMFAVSKKQMKQLQRQYRKTRMKKSKKSETTERALDFTRRLFSVPVDHWSDPNR